MNKLRQRAEESRRNQSTYLSHHSVMDVQQLIHELEVHHIELEMQNEELRKINEELSILHDKYVDLYDFAPSCYCTLDKNGQILEANLTLAEQLGVERSDLINLTFYHCIVQEDRDLFYLHLKKLSQTEAKTNCELRLVKSDGCQFYAQLESRIARNRVDNSSMIHTSITDITVLKKAQAALEDERASLAQRVEERTAKLSQANAELASAARLKDEFLANMSHELRTPLTTILGMSEFLSDELYGKTNEKQLKAAIYIEKSGHHLLSLITDILDLSKIEAGKMKLKPENLIIEDVCRTCVQMVEKTALQKSVSVRFDSDRKVKTLFADKPAVKQILVNLLNNAVKFTPRNGQVSLELQGDEISRSANIRVMDSGIGIPEQEWDNLFKPFVQIDGGLSRQHDGTGLGLALVYRLVELHGGSVRVESEIGKGSTFTVSLPWQENDKAPTILDDDDTTTAVNKDIKGRDTGAVVLVAEDNESNIVTIQSGLTAYGYQVIAAREGGEAIERALEIKPALIIMDIQMPGMDGLEATKQIRAAADEQLAKTPIIALTALAMPSDKKRCLEAGANVYLTKPINIKRLVTEIEEQLA